MQGDLRGQGQWGQWEAGWVPGADNRFTRVNIPSFFARKPWWRSVQASEVEGSWGLDRLGPKLA